jgi:invasion protein IalB
MQKFLLGLFSSCLIFSSTQSFGSDEKQNAFLSPWGNTCNATSAEAPKICVMERHLFLDKTSTKKLLTLGVRTAANEPPVMSIVLPLGVLLPVGVDVGFAKNSKKIPFIFCDSTGCIAQLRLDDSFLDDLSKSKLLNIKYQPINGKSTVINLDISGFADTYKKVKQ